MDEFICDVYGLLSFYTDLDDYLAGCNQSTRTFYDFHDVGYPTLALITLIVVAVFTAIYYGVDRVRFNKGWQWCVWGIIIGLVNALIGGSLVAGANASGDIAQYVGREVDFGQILGFSFVDALIAFVLYFVFSIIAKNFRVNTRNTPF